MLMYLVLKVCPMLRLPETPLCKRMLLELKFFCGSTKYTKTGMAYLIYILQVHVTDVTEMS